MTPPGGILASGLRKSFGGVEVLHGVDLNVPTGEIHGLLGQNGSGKSTLVKILTGVYGADAGALRVWDEEVHLPVHRPLDHGISVVHQDIGLVNEMSVLDNISATIGFGTASWKWIPERQERARLKSLMEELSIELDLDATAGSLTAAERTFTGVLRSLRALEGRALDRSILILDEPTSALPAPDALQITHLMRRAADAGAAVVFISHRLGEVMEVCDSATVLRSGSLVYSGSLAEVDASTMTEMILGRRMSSYYPPKVRPQAGPPVLTATGVAGGQVRDMTFSLHAGEVLGITGLMGMGQEDLPGLLSGATRLTAGEVTLADGTPLSPTVRGAIGQGVALVPANRARDGAWLDATASENLTLPRLKTYAGRGVLSEATQRNDVREWMDRTGTVPARPDQVLGGFSGGNQQKIVVAKWLATTPQVLLLDEPTQGVDAGAKHDLLEILLERAQAGAGLIIFSGDHDQLAHTCNRVLVMIDGQLAHEVTGDELTEASLMHRCNSLKDAELDAEDHRAVGLARGTTTG